MARRARAPEALRFLACLLELLLRLSLGPCRHSHRLVSFARRLSDILRSRLRPCAERGFLLRGLGQNRPRLRLRLGADSRRLRRGLLASLGRLGHRRAPNQRRRCLRVLAEALGRRLRRRESLLSLRLLGGLGALYRRRRQLRLGRPLLGCLHQDRRLRPGRVEGSGCGQLLGRSRSLPRSQGRLGFPLELLHALGRSHGRSSLRVKGRQREGATAWRNYCRSFVLGGRRVEWVGNERRLHESDISLKVTSGSGDASPPTRIARVRMGPVMGPSWEPIMGPKRRHEGSAAHRIAAHLHNLCPGGAELRNLRRQVLLHDGTPAGGHCHPFGRKGRFGMRQHLRLELRGERGGVRGGSSAGEGKGRSCAGAGDERGQTVR